MTRTPIIAPDPAHPNANKTIYFIRHGETDWNREARLQGQRDIPLNDLGRRQAADVAQHLRDAVGEDAARLPWFVSPMDRTRETLAITRRTLGLPDGPVEVVDRLREVGFGRWEGLTWKEVRRTDPAGAAARAADKWGYVPPGGESYAMLTERVRPIVETPETRRIIVAHGGVARAMLALMTGIDLQEATHVDIWQGRLLVFENGGAYWRP